MKTSFYGIVVLRNITVKHEYTGNLQSGLKYMAFVLFVFIAAARQGTFMVSPFTMA
jgi:predicted histidine transporter YuiF (NhaC family)